MKKYKTEIKISADFDNDPQGAMDALDKSGFAIFMISKKWYTDKRAQKEWRFAKDMKKPMVYIIREDGQEGFRADMFTDSLIGTINNYGDSKEEMGKTAIYLQAFMSAYIKLEDDSDKIISNQSTKKFK
jgi:hypothetical protein